MNKQKRIRQEKGITLIALIITIVVLLILAVVAIRAVQGDGIIEYAKNARDQYEQAQANEQAMLDNYISKMEESINGSGSTPDSSSIPEKNISEVTAGVAFEETTFVIDANGDKFAVPAGFSIVKNETTENKVEVDSGVVIENETEGSQFVWVPVTTEIVAKYYEPAVVTSKYEFNEEVGEEELMDIFFDNDSGNLKIINNKLGTTYANSDDFLADLQKDFNLMATSVNKYHGFYVGRYEVSFNSEKNAQSKGGSELKIKAATAAANSANKWYGLYALCKTYNTSSVASSMLWGCQSNAMSTWMEDAGVDIWDIGCAGKNDSGYAGGDEDDKINNVYDLMANVQEWTLKAETTDDRNRD